MHTDERPPAAMELAEILGATNNGRFADDILAELRRVRALVNKTQRSGKVTITIALEPSGSEEQIGLRVGVVGKEPPAQKPLNLFYCHSNGAFSRRPEGQRTLDELIKP